jgi:hypothetical protein
MKVGANSKITDCLVAKPMRYFELMDWSSLVQFVATTPPTKNEMKATIPGTNHQIINFFKINFS